MDIPGLNIQGVTLAGDFHSGGYHGDDGVIEATERNLGLFDWVGYTYFHVAGEDCFEAARKDVSFGRVAFSRDL